MPRSSFHNSFTAKEGSPPPALGFPNGPPPVFNQQYHQPPSNPGSYTLHSQMPGSFNGAIYQQDGRVYLQPPVPSNFPPNFSNAVPLNNSMIETQFPPTMMMAPNMQSYQLSHIPPMAGPQSFSGLYYDRISQHLPIEGDLGYALQRPGVVPSMENDQHGTQSQQHMYAPQQLQGPNESKSSRTRSTSFSGGSTNNRKVMHPPTSLHASFTGDVHASKELRNEFNENDFEIDSPIDGNNNNVISSSLTSSGSQGVSLLAQQLAEHSAITHDPNLIIETKQTIPSTNYSNIQMDHSAPNHHHHPTYFPQQGHPYVKTGSHSSLMQQPQTGSYYGYTPSNMPPFILSQTAPSSADPNITPYYPNIGHYSGSHGSFYNGAHANKYSDTPGQIPIFPNGQAHPIDSMYRTIDERKRNLPYNSQA